MQQHKIESGSEVAPPQDGRRHYVVAIAASAGGVTAIRRVLSMLPADFGASIVIVQHLPPNHPSMLAEILSRRTRLHVIQAREGDRLATGAAYIVPPDRHLVVNPGGTLSLSGGEQVHHLRPSADILFESVAAVYRRRAIAVVLTGTGTDGSDGVIAIKRHGGTVIVQEESSAEFPGMPESAIRTHSVDIVLPLEKIAAHLQAIVRAADR